EPLIVGGENVHSHLKITYPRPQELGADRIVNAVRALTKYEPPLTIIYFGTATTFSNVDRQGTYNDGIITPGINDSMDGLYVNAYSTVTKFDPPIIIVNFSIATTFFYVDKQATYSGGIITPGINVSMHALYRHAAKLPKIEIANPSNVIGKSTEGAMQSGVYY